MSHAPSLNERIPLNIVTGSLGSGKTTLLAHLLERGIEGRRPAVLINELGEISVDSAVLSGLGTEITELPSGCLCCMYSDDLRAVVESALAQSPDLLIIETSGAAYPDPLLYSLLNLGLTIDAVITVADALNLPRFVHESETCRAQLQSADVVLLNKIDLVEPAEVTVAEKLIRSISPRSLLLRTRHAQVDPHLLFGTSYPRTRRELDTYRERVAAGVGSGHLDEEGIESLVLNVSGPVDRRAIREFIRQLPDPVFRVKGIVHVAGAETPELLSVVCGRGRLFSGLPLDPTVHAAAGQLVVIGRTLARFRKVLQRSIDGCVVH